MKVLHLPFTYYPDPPGGTEVYVEGLVRHLDRLGVTSIVAAPSPRHAEEHYDVHGHRVHRFPVPAPADLGELYGDGSPAAAAAVRRVIDAERPDVVHMHAFTSGVSVLVAREVRAAGLPLVFTYHTPTVSCQRGTLLRYGRIPCDGRILVTRCSACIAQQHGAGATSWLLALVPPVVGALVARARMQGRRWAALRLTDLLRRRKRAFAEVVRHASVVVSVSDWVTKLLVRNGVPPRNIVLSRQGTEADAHSGLIARGPGRPLRAVMLSRLDPAKGIDVVAAALALVPGLEIEVDVYGVEQGRGDESVIALRGILDRERRIRFLPAFPNSEVQQVLARYNVTMVPSQVLETGPLVVLESLSCGVPVIGSDLGGIAERIRHEVDGLLVPAGDPAAWAAALTRLVEDDRLLPRLASGIGQQKTVGQVALEMRDLYSDVVGGATIGPLLAARWSADPSRE